MLVYNVEHHEWAGFLDEFIQRHRGEPITLEIFERLEGGPAAPTAEADRRVLEHKVFLWEVTAETLGTGRTQVTIKTGDGPSDLTERVIEAVSSMRLEQPDGPGDPNGWLRIDAEPKQSYVIRFPTRVIPGALDGFEE